MQIKIIPASHTENSEETSKSQFSHRAYNPQALLNSNSVLAVKKLKEKEGALDSMRRRLSVLKIHQQKSQNRYENNQRKMDYHQQAQQLAENDLMAKQRYTRKLQANVKSSREFNNKGRQNRRDRMADLRNSIHEMKNSQYRSIREVSHEIDRSVKQMKLEDFGKRKGQRDEIANFQRNQRMHFRQYQLFRRKQSISDKSKDVDECNIRLEESDQQMNRLSLIEAQLLERQSRSRMIARQSENKFLAMVMNPETLLEEEKRKQKHKMKNIARLLKGIAPQVPQQKSEYSFEKQSEFNIKEQLSTQIQQKPQNN